MWLRCYLWQTSCLDLTSFLLVPRHSFSMVNLLKGKSNQANHTERSPLLKFPQTDRWAYIYFPVGFTIFHIWCSIVLFCSAVNNSGKVCFSWFYFIWHGLIYLRRVCIMYLFSNNNPIQWYSCFIITFFINHLQANQSLIQV